MCGEWKRGSPGREKEREKRQKRALLFWEEPAEVTGEADGLEPACEGPLVPGQ